MDKKVEYKVEGDKLKVSLALEEGVDSDKDGEMSVKVSASLNVELDGSEVLDEVFKSSDLLQKAKDKLAALGGG